MNFTQEEFDQRIEKTRQAMLEAGLDVMIANDPSNMHWLTGYDGWSFYVAQAVIVFQDREPIWWGRPIDVAGVTATTRMQESQIYSYDDSYVMNPEKHPYLDLAQTLEQLGYGNKKIGVEFDNYYFSAASYDNLRAALPNAIIKDATALVNWQRAVKSPDEIEYMKKAGQIVGLMHQRIREKLVPGMRKCDLVAEIYDASIRGTRDFGGDYPAIVPMLPSGADAAAAHLTWDDRPMKSGEGTFFEIAGVYRRYHCPLSRTAYVGTPPQQFVDAHKAVLEGLEAGLEKARPGYVCEEMAQALYDVLKKHGIEKNNRCGYPIGLSYPPDWGERTMSLRPGDRTEFQPGMTLHFMPGLWMGDWGLEVTESVLIGEQEPILLSDVSRDLVLVS